MMYDILEEEWFRVPEDEDYMEWCSCGKELIDTEEQDFCDACMDLKPNDLEEYDE